MQANGAETTESGGNRLYRTSEELFRDYRGGDSARELNAEVGRELPVIRIDDKQEYAKVAHAINTYGTKNPKKGEIYSAYTDNYYYLYTSKEFGSFNIHAQIPIVGNERFIEEIDRGIRNDTYETPAGLIELADKLWSGQEFNSLRDATHQGRRGGSKRFIPLDVSYPSDGTAGDGQVGRGLSASYGGSQGNGVGGNRLYRTSEELFRDYRGGDSAREMNAFAPTVAEFDATRERAVREKGIVMPGLGEKEVPVVVIKRGESGLLHPFDEALGASDLKKQVKDYARTHGDEILGDVAIEGGTVHVSLTSIGEMVNPSSIKNSVSKDKASGRLGNTILMCLCIVFLVP